MVKVDKFMASVIPIDYNLRSDLHIWKNRIKFLKRIQV